MSSSYKPYKDAPGGMSLRAKARLTFVALIVFTFFLSLIAWPYFPQEWPASAFFSKFYPHLGLDLQGGSHLVYDADLSSIPTADASEALEGARDVIERRVNSLGVAEPVVQTTRQGATSRILVELAGVQDVNKAIELIGETPLLEFKEPAIATTTPEIDSEKIKALEEFNQKQEQRSMDLILRLQKGESFDALSAEYSDDTAVKNQGGDLGWAGRGQFTPVFETAVFDELQVGELRAAPLRTEFGFHIVKKLEERTNEAGQPEVRSAHILLRTESLTDEATTSWTNTALSGKHLKRAQVIFDPQTNEPQISLTFNSEGADLFEEITGRNIGQPVGIFLDGSVLSAPTVQAKISGGQAVISGQFTLQEAKLLSQRLNAGALPVPVQLVSQQTVGATLGHDSLAKSLKAGVAA